MKSKLFIVLTITVLFIGCAKPHIIQQSFDSNKIIHGSQIKDVDNLSDYAVYLDKGDTIPLKVSLDSEILGVADDSISLVLKRKIYFRADVPDALKNDNASSMSEAEKNKHLKKVKFLISPDAVNWALLTDKKAVEALKQLFGIKGGLFSAGMGMSKSQGVNAYFNIKTNSIK